MIKIIVNLIVFMSFDLHTVHSLNPKTSKQFWVRGYNKSKIMPTLLNNIQFLFLKEKKGPDFDFILCNFSEESKYTG